MQELNAALPIVSTDLPILNNLRYLHPKNAESGIDFMLSPIERDFKVNLSVNGHFSVSRFLP